MKKLYIEAFFPCIKSLEVMNNFSESGCSKHRYPRQDRISYRNKHTSTVSFPLNHHDVEGVNLASIL